jgi:Ca-activated chloride channel family protein
MNTPRNPNLNPVINPEDPKWTAYVLGELDEAERAEIERLVEISEEARALVEELTVATASLKEELTSHMPLMMSPEQRAAIRKAAEPEPRRWLEMFPAKWGMGLAAAAVIVLAVVLPVTLRDRAREDNVRTAEAEKLAVAPQVGSETDRADSAIALSDAVEKTEVSPRQETRQQPLVETQPRAVAAPVLTQEQFAALAQDGSVTPAQTARRDAVPSGRNSSVTGAVMDATGALIPGVTITARNTGTGIVVTGVTNEAGAYTLPNLAPGTYEVAASIPGFQTRTVTDLRLNADQGFRLNFPMEVASVNSSVPVSADSVLTSSAASVGEVLPRQEIANLPAVGNNVLDLLKIVPGATGDSTSGISAAAPPPPAPAPPPQASIREQSLAGGRGGGGRAAAPTTTTTINPDFVSELRLKVAPVDAELGRGNAQITVAAPPPPPPSYRADRVYNPAPNTEAYDRIVDNPFVRATQESLATFSIDVDTASYANVRRFLNQNQLPPRDAVRIEELINYFSYDYAQPSGNAPIAPNMEVAAAPWNPQHRLVRIGIKAREVNARQRPASNLVFLIDVSGSMNSPEKLPLVKSGLHMLVSQLGENDFVSIVVYAGSSGLVLRPTSGMHKETIRQAIDSLQPGGSTNGASGITLAYDQATANFLRNGVNRVILMTDGDFNVGITSQGALTRLIEDKAKSGVFLSVLGFGMGNIKDSTLEKLADQGNGHYAYIDNTTEARKVLVEEMSGTLVTVAKDVKIQVDFNPARVEAYRLIGYENRVLQAEDFNNDAKDAGDMGAGHTVTALFEVVPKGGAVPGPSIDPSKYTQPQARAEADLARNAGASSNEMLTLRVRYKLPDAANSTRMDVPLVDRGASFARASQDFRFAAAVAEFGMILRNSPYRGNARMESVLDIAEGSRGSDRNGYRQEFISLVQKARGLERGYRQ